jgi:hypothetical protein
VTVEEVLGVTVECYAGHRGEETPRVVVLGDRHIEVAAILDQWLAPDHRYFKFADPAGDTYIVRHDTMAGRWELTLYEQAGRDGDRDDAQGCR